jgi:4-diphosphocytidyl-2-C-methyl-D-erythritol kinase
MSQPLKIRSYAKINWTLDVLRRREDGYHELRTIYQTVSLYDHITFTAAPNVIEVVCWDGRAPEGPENLAHTAASLLRDQLAERGITVPGVRIEIDKRIPVGGGLGGGSSNAAATLLGLARFWNATITLADLTSMAKRLGSDVAFFLVGGTAVGVGRGEEVYPIDEVSSGTLLLVNPRIEVSTAEVYARFSRLTPASAERKIPFDLSAAEGTNELPLRARNDLERIVLDAYPEIAEVKRRLISLGARRALVSGSGATVFGVFEKLETRDRAQSEFERSGSWAEGVRTITRAELRDQFYK